MTQTIRSAQRTSYPALMISASSIWRLWPSSPDRTASAPIRPAGSRLLRSRFRTETRDIRLHRSGNGRVHGRNRALTARLKNQSLRVSPGIGRPLRCSCLPSIPDRRTHFLLTQKGPNGIERNAASIFADQSPIFVQGCLIQAACPYPVRDCRNEVIATLGEIPALRQAPQDTHGFLIGNWQKRTSSATALRSTNLSRACRQKLARDT